MLFELKEFVEPYLLIHSRSEISLPDPDFTSFGIGICFFSELKLYELKPSSLIGQL